MNKIYLSTFLLHFIVFGGLYLWEEKMMAIVLGLISLTVSGVLIMATERTEKKLKSEEKI